MKSIIKKFVPDRYMIEYMYYLTFNERPNLKNPKTFSEKINWIKIYGKLERFSNLVDKYEVRNYIKNTIGEQYLIGLIGIYDNPKDICFDKLPNRFVIKSTNGSGNNLICKDKNKLDVKETKDILSNWINCNFYKETREKQYKKCKPRIIIEEYIEDSSGQLKDYKFFCLGGKVRVIEVDIDRFGDARRDFYDCNWQKLNLKKGIENSNVILNKPKDLEKMIKLAEILSKDVELLRVDFYYVDNKIFFGELTFTPANGLTPFYPKEWDLKLASYVNLDNYNKKNKYKKN